MKVSVGRELQRMNTVRRFIVQIYKWSCAVRTIYGQLNTVELAAKCLEPNLEILLGMHGSNVYIDMY